MFGSKQQKQNRLKSLASEIQSSPDLTQAELARRLRVHRSSIGKDLVTLEQQGVLLSEDDSGRLRLFRRRK